MQINETLVLKLEKLARLELEKTERTQLIKDLNNILVMVETLQQLPTDEVAPLVYVSDSVNVTREDVVKNQLNRAIALQNAPLHNDQFFMIPKVIEK